MFHIHADFFPPGATKIPVAELAPQHFISLKRAISNILWSDRALNIFALVVDGFPTGDQSPPEHADLYDLGHNSQPTLEARSVVHSFRKGFSFRKIYVDAEVATF